MKKVGLIIGHTEKSGGGAITYEGESEYSFNSKIAEMVCDLSNAYEGLDCRRFFRDGGGVRLASNDMKHALGIPDISIELHFNSFSKPAFGCESLVAVLPGESYQEFNRNYNEAMTIAAVVAEHYNFRLRHGGVKEVSKGDRGFHNLRLVHEITKCPIAVLFEPNFLNFKTRDSVKIVEDPAQYALVLSQAIFEDVLGLEPGRSNV